MLTGFEKLTKELNEDELNKVDTIVKGLGARIGKNNAITSSRICDKMNLTAVRLRKIIHFIRINGLLFGLCSNSKGYYMASNLQEFEECIISLKQRIRSQVDVLNELEKQTAMYGGAVQLTLFE